MSEAHIVHACVLSSNSTSLCCESGIRYSQINSLAPGNFELNFFQTDFSNFQTDFSD